MRSLNPILALVLALFVCETALAQVSDGGGYSQPEKSDPSKSVTIYPNPATDFIQVKLGVLKVNQTKLTVHNILGNEITLETEVVDEHEVRIRVKELPVGYYLLAVRDEQSQFRGTYKFLKR